MGTVCPTHPANGDAPPAGAPGDRMPRGGSDVARIITWLLFRASDAGIAVAGRGCGDFGASRRRQVSRARAEDHAAPLV